MDLSQPADSLRAFVRARASLEPEDVVFWWTGNIYSLIPGERSQHLFQFEGYNIGRIEPIELDEGANGSADASADASGGYRMITREASFYKDAATGEILERWSNPLNGREVEVIHVWNDPVNQTFLEQSARGPFRIPFDDLGNGTLCLYFDVLLAYPSPLPRADFPLYSQSDLYQGAELFQFFVDEQDLAGDAPSIPASNSWTRIGPWVPWMEMADRPGNLLYQCRGAKLAGGYADLPQSIRDYVDANGRQYAHAPDSFETPNETSWTYMKKVLAEREAG